VVAQVGVPASGDWLTIHEASALIGVSPATLRRWSDSGEIKAFTTPGGHRRFARTAVLGMLPASRRRRPGLDRLGETPGRLARVYRRHISQATESADWIRLLDDAEREPFREHGRRIANALLAFLDASTTERRAGALADAARSSTEYGRIAAARGIPVADTVELFLRFRMPLLRELGAAARRRGLDTAEATDLLEAATEAVDTLLAALVRGHETGTACPLTSRPRGSIE
jgi:excisionase family DNA binding protein